MEIKITDVKLVPIADVKPNPKNRNHHPQDQIDRLAELFKYQGMRTPLIVSNQTGVIVAGNGRYLAALRAGLKEVPVSHQDFESIEQEYAFGVSDNGISAWAELDLAGINSDLGDLGPDFDLNWLGIKDFTLDMADKEGLTDPDAVPDVPEVPKSKLGDIYQLGEHRLMCGDATSSEDVSKLMMGEKADMLFTDPPYGVSFVGVKGTMFSGGKKIGKNSSIEIENDDLRGDEISNLFKNSISVASSFISDTASFYIFFAINRSSETLNGIKDCGLEIRNWLIWDKGNVGFHAMGANYKPNYESFLYCHKKSFAPAWCGDAKQQTIWRHSSDRLGLHPTMKPVELIQQAFKNHNPHIVLDVFGGSGSTMIACEQTHRQCRMMEIDPAYCDVIVSRWEDFTGQQAVLLNPS